MNEDDWFLRMCIDMDGPRRPRPAREPAGITGEARIKVWPSSVFRPEERARLARAAGRAPVDIHEVAGPYHRGGEKL